MPLLESLVHRPFMLLWSGQSLSRFGDSLYRIALAGWVLEQTRSAIVMGTVLMFWFIPMLLFLLIGGSAVDRLPRVGVMLVSDVTRGVAVGLVSMLAFADSLQVWHVYVASLVFGVADAFFQPAYAAAVPELVPGAALTSANSLTTLSQQVANLTGPALGAYLVRVGGAPLAMAMNSGSFLVSAACLVPLTRLPSLPSSVPSSGIIRDLGAGFLTVRQTPWLWRTIAIAALGNVAVSGPMSVALPFLLKESFQKGVGALGLLYSIYAAGSILAAVGLGRCGRLRHRGRVAYTAWIGCGLMVLALGLPIPMVGAWVAVLIAGACLAIFALIWTRLLQEYVPHGALGRVSSIDAFGSFALLPVGYSLAGWSTEVLGAPRVFLIGGALTMAVAAMGLLHPAIRDLD